MFKIVIIAFILLEYFTRTNSKLHLIKILTIIEIIKMILILKIILIIIAIIITVSIITIIKCRGRLEHPQVPARSSL